MNPKFCSEVYNDTIRKAVRKQYGKVAESNNQNTGCSISSCCNNNATATSTSLALGYTKEELLNIPDGANMGLGCGNPQTIASLKAGETVLDLGSGGGFDCFLAAKEVGKTGQVIGVDMTPEMVSKARYNTAKTTFKNVDFRLGEIENLPVANTVIDVIISNCVINLSPDKKRVFEESYRVLKSTGRLAISDIVLTAKLPEVLNKDMELLTGCMAGASYIEAIEQQLKQAGFIDIKVKPKDASKAFIRNWIADANIEDYIVSATIEAVKP